MVISMNKILISSALALFSFPVFSSTTYTYAQAANYQKLQDYTQCMPEQDCKNYTNQMKVQGSFTLSNNIPPNTKGYILTNDMSNLVSYSFTDGLVNYTKENSVLATFQFDTDQDGNIINSNIYIQNFQINNRYVNLVVIDSRYTLSGVHGGECLIKKIKPGSGQEICDDTTFGVPGASVSFNSYGSWTVSTFPEGQNKRGLVGKWNLVGMTLAGQSISCPGELPLPPGVPDSIRHYAQCKAGEYMELAKRQSRGIFFEDITNIPTTSPLGTWTSVREMGVRASKNSPAIPAVDYLIFDDADEAADPQAYEYYFKDNKNGLVIKKSVGVQGVKYPVELYFTKQK